MASRRRTCSMSLTSSTPSRSTYQTSLSWPSSQSESTPSLTSSVSTTTSRLHSSSDRIVDRLDSWSDNPSCQFKASPSSRQKIARTRILHRFVSICKDSHRARNRLGSTAAISVPAIEYDKGSTP